MFNFYTLPRSPPINSLWSPLRLYDDPFVHLCIFPLPPSPRHSNPASTPDIQRNFHWNILLYNYANTNGLDTSSDNLTIETGLLTYWTHTQVHVTYCTVLNCFYRIMLNNFPKYHQSWWIRHKSQSCFNRLKKWRKRMNYKWWSEERKGVHCLPLWIKSANKLSHQDFSSPELKAQVRFFDRLSSVRLSICL